MTDTLADKKTENTEADSKNEPQDLPVDPLTELTDLLKRTQANFENYRKQTERRVEEIKQLAAKDVLQQLLPIVDGFDLAFKNTHNTEEFMKGIELIRGQLQNLLEKNELRPIATVGARFDPYLHEALMRVESGEPEGTIIEEFQKGYTLHGQVIRHALVKISGGVTAGKKKEEKKEEKKDGKMNTDNQADTIKNTKNKNTV